MVDLTPRIIANGMLRLNTPVQDHRHEWGLWVKREDRACTPPGPYFSKSRGVYAHVAARPERLIGVLDTSHSQGGWAVARACSLLGKRCVVYYPELKYDPAPKPSQTHSARHGASLVPLPGGRRSAVLYHAAKKDTEGRGGYMMPNALKLEESVEETAREVVATLTRRPYDVVVVPASSGTIAAGVLRGLARAGAAETQVVVHLGYSRPVEEVRRYLLAASGVPLGNRVDVIDEGYAYKDAARGEGVPPWPCNVFYDLKTLRWFREARTRFSGLDVLLWNVG